MLTLDEVLKISPNADENELRSKGLLPQPAAPAAPTTLPSTAAPTTPTPVAKMTPPVVHPVEQQMMPAAGTLQEPGTTKFGIAHSLPVGPLNAGPGPELSPLNAPANADMGVKPMTPPTLGFHDRQALPTMSGGVLPGTSQFYENALERREDQKANPLGSSDNHSGVLGKIGHVLGRIGNTALDALAPETATLIPGTDLNAKREENANERKLEGAKKEESTEKLAFAREASEESLRGAQTEEAKARARALEAPPEKTGKIAFHYQTADGKTLAVYENGDTKELPAGQEKETQEKYPGLTADEIAMFPPPQKEQFKTDAEFAAARSDWGKQVSKYKEDQKVREAVAGRAPLQREYNALDTKNGNAPVFATPEMMKGEPGRYMPSGEGSKDLKASALVEDIRGAIKNSRDAINRMGTESFDKGQRAMLAAALASPEGQGHQYIESLLRENLSEAQHDYIIAAFQLKENAMAMRSVLGAGQGSEDLRNAVTATLPGAGTPTKEYAEKQLNAFEGQLNRLSRGIPSVKLKPEENTGGGGKAAPDGKVSVFDPQGNEHFVLKEKKDAFLKDPKYKGWTDKAPEKK